MQEDESGLALSAPRENSSLATNLGSGFMDRVFESAMPIKDTAPCIKNSMHSALFATVQDKT